jgi:hypothetical protein
MLAISNTVRHLCRNLHTVCFEAAMAESIKRVQSILATCLPSNTVRHLCRNLHTVCFEAAMAESITSLTATIRMKRNRFCMALTSPRSGGRSAGIVHWLTKATEIFFFLLGKKLSSTNRGTFLHLFVGTERNHKISQNTNVPAEIYINDVLMLNKNTFLILPVIATSTI